VTGWLQIQGLKKSDEGIYICHTKNKYGATYASARLKVIDGTLFSLILFWVCLVWGLFVWFFLYEEYRKASTACKRFITHKCL